MKIKKKKTASFEIYRKEIDKSVSEIKKIIKNEFKSKKYIGIENYIFSKIKEYALKCINCELPKLESDKKSLDFKIPPTHVIGDFSLEAPIIARKQGLDSKQTAEKIAIIINKKKPKFIKSALASGPFVNIELDKKDLYAEILIETQELKKNYGGSNKNSGKIALVDFSAPNIAKPMGVGHLRSTIIGQALSNIYEKTGYSVIKDNHIGDWGTQFGSLIWAYHNWKDDKKMKKDPIRELKNLYTRFHKEAEQNPKIKEEARQIFADLEKNDAHLLVLWKRFRDLSLISFEKIYKRLGVHFDIYIGESYFADKCDKLVKDCLIAGVCKIDKETGAVAVYSLEGNPSFLIQKNDGSSLYITRDLATLKFRIDEFKPNNILYVVGQEQKLHFKQLFELVKRLKYLTSNIALKHIDFGMVLIEGKKMSTRRGKFVELEDLLDKSVSVAKSLILKKGSIFKNKEMEQIAEIIGVGAILYNDLRQSRVSNVSFDWKKMLNLEGGSAAYLQYTYTRIKSILRKLENKHKKGLKKEKVIFQENIEFEIAKKIMLFPETIIRAQESDSPHCICVYLEDLAKSFNSFYNDVPVVSADNDDIKKSRVLLISAVAHVIKNGLSLLNIKVPEKM